MSSMPTEHYSPLIDRKPGAAILIRTGLRRLVALVVRWRRRAAARRELRILCELDDHMLKDIGLTRSQLRREAARPFWLGGSSSLPMPCAPPRRDEE